MSTARVNLVGIDDIGEIGVGRGIDFRLPFRFRRDIARKARFLVDVDIGTDAGIVFGVLLVEARITIRRNLCTVVVPVL